MGYRPWNWADRVLGEHGDRLYELEALSAARHEHELSQRWWAERRFREGMAAATERVEQVSG